MPKQARKNHCGRSLRRSELRGTMNNRGVIIKFERRPTREKMDPTLRDLFACMTIPEAAQRFHKHQNTVRWAIMKGKLDCRLSGNIWLITAYSLIKLWGEP